MRSWPTILVLAAATVSADAADAAARTILGAGRDAITLRWDPASGPVAYYEVTCTVNGVPEFLVGTTPEPEIEIVLDSAGWGETLGDCVAQAFDADGYPGPRSEPSEESFVFLPDADLDGDGTVGNLDLLRFRIHHRGRNPDMESLQVIGRTWGCRVDRVARVYVDCPSADAAPAR